MAETRQLSLILRRTTVQHARGRRTQGVARHRLDRPYLRPRPRPSNPSHHGDKRHIPDSLLCVSRKLFAFMVQSLHLIVGALPGLSHAPLQLVIIALHSGQSLRSTIIPTYLHQCTPRSLVSCLLNFFFLHIHRHLLHVIVPYSTHTYMFPILAYVAHFFQGALSCPHWSVSGSESRWFYI